MAGHEISALVARALARGALLGDGFPKQVTVAGRRRWTIRVQSDIFRALWHGDDGGANYPDLTPAIVAAVAAWRATTQRPRPTLVPQPDDDDDGGSDAAPAA